MCRAWDAEYREYALDSGNSAGLETWRRQVLSASEVSRLPKGYPGNFCEKFHQAFCGVGKFKSGPRRIISNYVCIVTNRNIYIGAVFNYSYIKVEVFRMIKKGISTLCALVAAAYLSIAPIHANEDASKIRAIHAQLIKVNSVSSSIPTQKYALSATTFAYVFTAGLDKTSNLVISTYEKKPSRNPSKASALILLEQYTDVEPYGPGNGDSVIIYNRSSNPHEEYGSVPFGEQLDVGIGGADRVPSPVYCHRNAAIGPLYQAIQELKKNTKK